MELQLLTFSVGMYGINVASCADIYYNKERDKVRYELDQWILHTLLGNSSKGG